MFLAYSAKPFRIASEVVQQTQSQDKQHIATLMGGLSMGVGACMCICLACYRMMEGVHLQTKEGGDKGGGPRRSNAGKDRRNAVLDERVSPKHYC